MWPEPEESALIKQKAHYSSTRYQLKVAVLHDLLYTECRAAAPCTEQWHPLQPLPEQKPKMSGISLIYGMISALDFKYRICNYNNGYSTGQSSKIHLRSYFTSTIQQKFQMRRRSWITIIGHSTHY